LKRRKRHRKSPPEFSTIEKNAESDEDSEQIIPTKKKPKLAAKKGHNFHKRPLFSHIVISVEGKSFMGQEKA
jgi:hypothetical protein